MEHYDNELIKRITRLSNDLISDEVDKVPLHIFGKLIKKNLLRDNVYLRISNKRLSPNTYLKMYYGNLSSFITKKTKHNIKLIDNIFYIVFS
jgi:hypothetical protein